MFTNLISIIGWQFWFITLIAFLIIEVVSLNLISVWFVLGSLVALVLSLFGFSQTIQIIVFIVVSSICLVLFFFIAKPKLNKRIKTSEKTNADRIINQEGVVIERIDPLANTGLIRVRGQIWSARSSHDQIIQKDKLVLVKEIKGVKAIVELVIKNKES